MSNPTGEARAVRTAYALRAKEYIEVLGTLEVMSAVDRLAIATWARQVDGRIIDAGCGPGHWTDYLRDLGTEIVGVDIVPAFIESARSRFPDTTFKLGELNALPAESASLGGILAWYSVIHLSPTLLPATFQEFARCLAPGGKLLLGFFEGHRVEEFDHAVTTAHFWSVDEMTRLLADAGFEVTEVQTRIDPGARPHAAIAAQRAHGPSRRVQPNRRP